MHWNKKISAIHIVAWLLIFTASFGSYINIINIQYAFLRSLVNIIPLMLLFYANASLISRFYEKEQISRFFALALSLSIGVISIRILANILLQKIYLNSDISSETGIFVFLAIITTFGTQILSSILTLLRNKIKSERSYLNEINNLKTEQLKYLKAQLNPHFLFNTLNNIYALVLSKSENAPEMILKLSDLLRYSLYSSEKKLVPLQEEIDQINKYISLFTLKTNRPLNIDFAFEPYHSETSIPPMMLITFIENAFKHGDIISNEQGILKIEIKQDSNEFTFKCSNSYDVNHHKDETSGIGLQNIKERLNLLFKGCHYLSIKDVNNFFEIELKLIYR